jgi:hypothetical protein
MLTNLRKPSITVAMREADLQHRNVSQYHQIPDSVCIVQHDSTRLWLCGYLRQ